MSTHIPWFRYGLKETKRWLQRLRQGKLPCQGEAQDALDRCVRKKERIPFNKEDGVWRCEYCGEEDYGCGVDKDGMCIKYIKK